MAKSVTFLLHMSVCLVMVRGHKEFSLWPMANPLHMLFLEFIRNAFYVGFATLWLFQLALSGLHLSLYLLSFEVVWVLPFESVWILWTDCSQFFIRFAQLLLI